MRKIMRYIPRLLPIALLPLLSCAHAPVVETQSFAELMDAVTAASRSLIDDHAHTIEELRAHERTETVTVTEYPTAFDPDIARTVAPEDPGIAGFRNAVLALDLYRGAVRAASEGHDSGALEHSANAAASLLSISNVSAGLPLGSAISGLVRFLADARDRAGLNKAIRSGAPAVGEILDVLGAATPDLYRVRVGVTGEAIADLAFKQESILTEIDRIAGEHAPPDAGTPDALERARLEADVHALRMALSPDAPPRALPVGSRPHDSLVQQRLAQQLRVAQGLHEQQRAHTADILQFHSKLGGYVRLITETQNQLTALNSASQAKGIRP
ncbi:MAG: hypothetical protein SGI88_02130 [Candidatus Hydrogenedentes bacterium]|nr:hypothetical protein [Candidatus Hydrogenedentota bacterium]